MTEHEPGPVRPSDADPVNAYWNALARDEPPPTQLDPALATTIQRVHQFGDSPLPDPAFVARLRRELSEGSARTHPRIAPATASAAATLGRRSRTIAAHRVPARDEAPSTDHAVADRLSARASQAPLDRWQQSGWPSSQPEAWPRSRWVIAQLATAALLAVTLVGSFLAFGPGRHQRLEPPLAATEAATLMWESRGDPAQPIDHPGHLTLDPSGNLWVTDGRRDGFQILSPDGTFLERWGTSGAGDGQFKLHDGDSPVGAVAFDRAGNSSVADTGNWRIQKFGPDRSFLLSWGRKGHADGEFLRPDHLAIDGQDQVYVLDGERDDIQVFDAYGAYLRTIGGYGTTDGRFLFDGNAGLTIDRSDNLWVADIQNLRIQEFSPDGTFVRAFGRYGLSPGMLLSPNGVAVDQAGRVFVVDASTTGTRVQIFSPEGAYLGGWHVTAESGAQHAAPSGIVLDGKGNVYVTDYVDDRILKLRLLPPFAPE